MRKISVGMLVVAAIFVFSNLSHAQGFYSMGSGSYMTGYGRVYGSFGSAMATQQMYQTIQMNLQKSMARAAMVKKWGEAAVRKAEEESRRKSSTSSANKSSTATTQNSELANITPPPTPKYYGRFRPDASVNMAKTISETLFEKPDERAMLKQVIEVVHGEYQKEANAKGWNNNLAGGMTFFLLSMSMVYNDSAEPDDAVANAVYEAVNQSVDAVPDFATASDKDKQTINDMLVGFSALPLATYIEGKQNGNGDTIKTAQTLAGEMIKLVLKTDPKNVKLDNSGLKIGN